MKTTTPLLTLPLLLATSCGEDTAQAGTAHSLSLSTVIPGLEPAKIKMNAPEDFSEAKAALGKKLFFDTRLSSNGEMSCETCHVHAKGWTDGIRFSTKVNGDKNTRNSPTLYNVGYHALLYWDGRAPSLEANIGAAWKGHMGGGEQIVEAINGIDGYKSEFESAYGGPATMENIPGALAHFVRTLRAGDSAYDRGELSPQAKSGEKIFIKRCNACHTPPLFTNAASPNFHNAGVGETEDLGRKKHDDAAVPGSFKVPTLRNVTKTAPYFHDGSVAELREAVTIMAHGGIDNEHLDPVLKANQAMPKLHDQEIDQLLEFLKALESNESFEKPTLPK